MSSTKVYYFSSYLGYGDALVYNKYGVFYLKIPILLKSKKSHP